MTTCNEAHALAEAYADVRKLTRYFLSKTESIDPYKNLEVEGVTLNSLYWIMAHLAWAEHNILIEGLGKQAEPLPWLNDFAVGTTP